MNRILLFFLLLISPSILVAQQAGRNDVAAGNQKYISGESSEINLTIYPVPVKNNYFTIKCDKDISSVKVTNIIGQDVYRMRFTEPQQIVRVSLEAPPRGMYLVTIIFPDGLRIVKKIMIEEPK